MLTFFCQCLGITCDNASCNDTMIDQLRITMKTFPGDANRARCFNHVVALVAKRMVCQFDVSDKEASAALDEAEKELRELAKGIDIEELVTRGIQDTDEDDDNDEVDKDGMIEEMSAEDRAELDANTRPVRLVLVKVGRSVALCATQLIYTIGVAAKDRVCYDTLDNDCAAFVVSDTGKVETRDVKDAA